MTIATTEAHPRPGPAHVERIADRAAFEEAFSLYAPALLRYVTARIGRDAAADVVAESFALAYRDRSRFDPARGTLRGWLYGIVSNMLRDHRRSERRHLAALSRLEAEWTPQHAAAEPAGSIFLHALTQLGRDDRDLILLLAWGDLSYDEIAQATGRSLPSVRARLHRLRTNLRHEIGEHHHGT